MSDRKNWRPQEDQAIRRLVESEPDSSKVKWTQIANKLNSLHILDKSIKRTGKQCRQRWHNQLNPVIKKDTQWGREEQKILFEAHNELGNKWAQIAARIQGRTDNCVKNHFYSALRKGMRRINKYISQFKKKQTAAIKEFKPLVLNKVLAVADGNYETKLQVKSKAIILAKDIKNQLIQQSQQQEQEVQIMEKDYHKQKILDNIQEFTRNCKRRKGQIKKGAQGHCQTEQFSEQNSQQSEQQLSNQNLTNQENKNLFSTVISVPDFKGRSKEEEDDKNKQSLATLDPCSKGFFSKSSVNNSRVPEMSGAYDSNPIGFAPYQNRELQTLGDNKNNNTGKFNFINSIPSYNRYSSGDNMENPKLEQSAYFVGIQNPIPQVFNDMIQSIEINNCPRASFMYDSGRFGVISGSMHFGNFLQRSFPDLTLNPIESGGEIAPQPRKQKTSIITQNKN